MTTISGTGYRAPHGLLDHAPAMGTDLGRRLAARRAAAGLSRADLGDRSGFDAHYITLVEERGALPSIGTLVRLAGVLGTTVEALAGRTPVPEAGPRAKDPAAGTAVLDGAECRRLLGVRGIGRVAVFTADGPAVLPVNYLVVGQDIAFRTAADTVLARAAGTDAAFEVERIDEVAEQAWSVLAVGVLETATHPDELRRMALAAHSVPWAGGERTRWMKLAPVRFTGRRIAHLQ
ncbi:pyridoxamine 5'-phosphate oxidase family protein [Streptomyces yangpuensis]|uniref:pyridoxamine 5'-phosphate oxidase family protein n=1 Tax=Streptomyces yangpuensis TaxID=1648182 RepID=UPI00342C897D